MYAETKSQKSAAGQTEDERYRDAVRKRGAWQDTQVRADTFLTPRSTRCKARKTEAHSSHTRAWQQHSSRMQRLQTHIGEQLPLTVRV